MYETDTNAVLADTISKNLEHTVRTMPEREAFRQFDYAENRWMSVTWGEFHQYMMRWRRALYACGFTPGDRAAMLLTNSIDAVTFDQSVLASGLVPVPLHAIDTAGASAYILEDSGSSILVTTSRARWNAIRAAGHDLSALRLVVLINELGDEKEGQTRVMGLEAWLALGNGIADETLFAGPKPEDLAGLIYTSGTTGRPKGVMITHANIAANVRQISRVLNPRPDDIYLSFLPFSHTFERTVAHYVSLSHGAAMAFARSVQHIEADFLDVRPTLMCTVPRVLERIYQKIQLDLAKTNEHEQYIFAWAAEAGWRRFCRENDLPVETSERAQLDDTILKTLDEDIGPRIRAIFGGNFRTILSGGASLNATVSRFFCAMGLPVRQCYGLTETCPIVSLTRAEKNHPTCVGHPVSETEVRLGERDELQVRGPQVMKGYWKRPEDTARAFTEDGWFRTGDQADLSDGGRIRIMGRIKEIIVTSTGEKISPVDLEFAIQKDPLFSQVFVVGENRPFISAILVVEPSLWQALCAEMELDPTSEASYHDRGMLRLVLKRVRATAKEFPSYGIPRSVALVHEPFTMENGLLTPTMKPRRAKIAERWRSLIEEIYAGHPAA